MLFANTITTLKISDMYNEILSKNRKTQGNMSGRVIIVGHGPSHTNCLHLGRLDM